MSFWNLSDTEKLILILKILVMGFGYAMVIVPCIIIVAVLVDDILDRLRERRERKRSKQQKNQLNVYTPFAVGTSSLDEARGRHRDDSTVEFFVSSREVLHNDYH